MALDSSSFTEEMQNEKHDMKMVNEWSEQSLEFTNLINKVDILCKFPFFIPTASASLQH